jgi:hypothetical protein
MMSAGCMSTPGGAPAAAAPRGPYMEASASALAFEPPIAMGVAHPELARAPRQNSAFYGYQEQSTEYYVTAFADSQSDWGDTYQRDAVSVRSGVRYR